MWCIRPLVNVFSHWAAFLTPEMALCSRLVPQAFGGGSDHWGRPPSAKEFRLMVYGALVAGSTGTIVFGWKIWTPDVVVHSGVVRNDLWGEVR